MKQLGCAFRFAGGIFLLCIAVPSLTKAQPIEADTTMSPNDSTVTRQGNEFEIKGGVEAQSNLFHSFRKFSVPEGTSAYFNNADSIQNIITRVTGSSVSQINGTIQANGNANLFLLNPNGIIFGPNAQLNVGGSFLASTANSLIFNDGTFNAAAPQAPPLLIIDAPVGLQYGANSEGINDSSLGLEVQPGKALAFVGGMVHLRGGQVTAPGGRVELGGLAESGTVELEVEGNNFSLSFPEQVSLADVLLAGEATVDVVSSGGGDIAVTSRNLDMSEDSQLLAGIGEGLGMKGAQAGDITIQATGAVSATDNSDIANITEGRGNAGSIYIRANDVSLNSLEGITTVRNEVSEGAKGNSGNIDIQARSLSLLNGAQLRTLTAGIGDAGDVTITVDNTVEIAGADQGFPSAIFSTVFTGGEGDGGNINISTGSLTINEIGIVDATTFGRGNAGKITIIAKDAVSLSGSNSTQIASFVGPEAKGKGGDIEIQTRSLSMSEGALLSTFIAGESQLLSGESPGQGEAGDITISAADSVEISGVGDLGFSTGLYALTDFGAEGPAGDITINTDAFRIADRAVVTSQTANSSPGGKVEINATTVEIVGGGEIQSNTSGSGNAGNIAINAIDSIILSGSDQTFASRLEKFDPGFVTNVDSASGLFANADEDSTGNGGNITLNTEALIVRDEAVATVSSLGSGEAGNLEVTAPLIALREGQLRAETGSEGGNIVLQNVNSLVLQRSTISAAARGKGDGGNVTIDTDILTALDNSSITASAIEGEGGNIQIAVQGLFAPSSAITASSKLGIDGEVNINGVEVDPSQSLVELPLEVVNVEEIVAQGCGVEDDLASSKFVIAGRGGLPPSPSETVENDTILVDLGTNRIDEAVSHRERQESQSAPAVTAKPNSDSLEIVEAQGWIENADGKVVLTAQAQSVPYSPGLQQANCRDSRLSTSVSDLVASTGRTGYKRGK